MRLCKILLTFLLFFPWSGKHLLSQDTISAFPETNTWNVHQVIDSVLLTIDKLRTVEYRLNYLYLQQLGGDVPLKKSLEVFLKKNPDNTFEWDIEWNEFITFEDNQKPVSTIFSQMHIDTVFYRRTSYYSEIFEYPGSRKLDNLGSSKSWHELVHLHYYLKDLDSLRDYYQIMETDENPELIVLERTYRNDLTSMLVIRTVYVNPNTWLLHRVTDLSHDLKIDLYHGFDLSFNDYRLDKPFHDSILNPTYFALQGYNTKVIDIGIQKAIFDSIKSETVVERPVLQIILDIPVIDLNGDTTNITIDPGTWLVIDLWYYNCIPCMRSMYNINQALQKGKYNQVQFAGLNGIDQNPKLLQQLYDYGITIPLYLIDREFLQTWNINSFPTYLVYDPAGNFVGAGHSGWLYEYLEELELNMD